MGANSETDTRPPCGEWLVAFIGEEFADVRYPATGLFQESGDPLILRWRAHMEGKDWKAICKQWEETAARGFNSFDSIWPLMYVEAIYYCTPAILTVAAREINTELVDQFVWQVLDPDFCQTPYQGSVSDYVRMRFEQFIELLTEGQRHAIALTLRCLIGDTESFFEPIWQYWAALSGLDARTVLPEN